MWKGSFVALVTPYLDDGRIDQAAFDRLVELHLNSATSGLVLLGSTGEAALLEEGEKEDLVARAAAQIRECRHEIGQSGLSSTFPLVVGISSPSTARSVAFGKRALALGADALMATPPYYVRPDWRGVKAHFRAIDALGAPLIIYNHPGRTGISLSEENLHELSLLESVVAIKESGGASARIGSMPVFCGDDPLFEEMATRGCAGSVSVIANAYPKEWSAFVEGKESFPFNDLVAALSSVPNPVGIKYLMEKLGLCKAHVRLPLVALTAEQKSSIEMCLNPSQK